MAGENIALFAIWDTWEDSAATMRAALRAASRTTTTATSGQVEDLLDVFSRNVAAAERQAFFDELGGRAHDAIISSYTRRQRGPSGYRADDAGKMRRFAGGKMEALIRNEDNIFVATPDGITFLPNPKNLDHQAAQWYRLNFGAGPSAGARPRRFDVSISNVFLFSLGFTGNPSEPFRIPRGFWVEGGQPVEPGAPGTSEFYPRRSAARIGLKVGRSKKEQKDTPMFFPGRRVARGIQAENFFDAGLARFTEDLRDPQVGLQALYRRFYERGLANVRPTRPPTVGVSAFRFR